MFNIFNNNEICPDVVLSTRIGHDSGACILIDGKIIADVQEERFSRIKNDSLFPINSIQYCLNIAGLRSTDIDILAIPTINLQPQLFSFIEFLDIHNIEILSSRRINKSSINIVNAGDDLGLWNTKSKISKLSNNNSLETILPLYQEKIILKNECTIFLVEHHLAHAASALLTNSDNNQNNAICITMDGVGDNVSNAVWKISNNYVHALAIYNSTSSLGWLYGIVTESIGWKQNQDEWKVMGMAPYGENLNVLEKFHPIFSNGQLSRGIEYGNFGRWNDHGFNHYHNDIAYKIAKKVEAYGPENIACELQSISEEQSQNFILPWLEKERTRDLCCAGGFFLNVKMNQKIWERGKLDNHWIYPNSADAGLFIGSALMSYSFITKKKYTRKLETMYLGPEFSNKEIKQILDDRQINYEYHDNIEEVTSIELANEKVVSWFQGRMESGPRALGNRSILMSPCNAKNKDIINRKIKYRESFRPFCPSIQAGYENKYLKKYRNAEYMIISFDATEEAKKNIPAVVHIDGTTRPQIVYQKKNPRYYNLIEEFGKKTGTHALLNTSMNIKGEPIICNPREAIKCFYDTGIDSLVMGNYIVRKKI
jgi:carbamoyltransferase